MLKVVIKGAPGATHCVVVFRERSCWGYTYLVSGAPVFFSLVFLGSFLLVFRDSPNPKPSERVSTRD